MKLLSIALSIASLIVPSTMAQARARLLPEGLEGSISTVPNA